MMKRIAIIIVMLLLQTTISVVANTNDNNAQKPHEVQVQSKQAEANQAQKKNDYSEEYLLKYNIDDLEAAPWLHGGKRVY